MRNSVEQQVRAVAQKVLDRIVSDPDFRKALIDDSKSALANAGIEQELDQIDWPVAGAALDDCTTTCGYRSCTRTCITTCHNSCRQATL